MSRTLITICARGGSKGIPKKNIKLLNGVPLIGYTIDFAKKYAAMRGADIALSTDDPEIKVTAAEFGLSTGYTRPEIFAGDLAGKVDAISDLLKYEQAVRSCLYDYVIDLDVTSPIRTTEDVTFAMEQLKGNDRALNIFSVNLANRNPYFNMVEQHEDGFYRVVKPLAAIKSRQTAPVVYDMNASFYIFKRAFFEENCKSTTTDRSLAYVMNHICFDLDHTHDFIVMDVLLRNKVISLQV